MIYSAVVGLGIGNQHALAIQENSDCELKYLCDFDAEKISQFKKEYPHQNIQNLTFEKLLKQDDLNMISLASFDSDHFQQVLDAINAEKHVFVEKPLCQTWDQLISLYEVFKKKPYMLMSNLVLRTSELFCFIHNMIQNDEFGEIYYFEGDYLYGRIDKITKGWRKDIVDYSVMEGGGIHMIDLMMNLTGQKPENVTSTSNKFATKNTEFCYDDFHSSTFNFSNGMVGKITANFGCMHPHQHIIKIYGTKKTFIYDDQGARLFTERFDGATPQIVSKKAKPEKKGLLIHDFVQNIKENDFSSAQKEFDLMSVVLAANKALNNECKTEVKYLEC